MKSVDEPEPDDIDTFSVLTNLLNVSSAYHAEFSTEIVTALRTQPNIYECNNSNYTENMPFLRTFTSRYPIYVRSMSVNEIKALTKAGAGAEMVDMEGNTLLKHMLSERRNFNGFRETLELLLFRNPDVHVNKDAVEEAIVLDKFVE